MKYVHVHVWIMCMYMYMYILSFGWPRPERHSYCMGYPVFLYIHVHVHELVHDMYNGQLACAFVHIYMYIILCTFTTPSLPSSLPSSLPLPLLSPLSLSHFHTHKSGLSLPMSTLSTVVCTHVGLPTLASMTRPRLQSSVVKYRWLWKKVTSDKLPYIQVHVHTCKLYVRLVLTHVHVHVHTFKCSTTYMYTCISTPQLHIEWLLCTCTLYCVHD